MANTVNQLNYANTFGDWMVTTDALASENNILAKGDYTKDTGTLTLNETTKNALFSNGVAVFQNQLISQGVGSSVTIDRDVTVKYGTMYLKYNDASKANLALVVNGQANVDGLLFANGVGTSILSTGNILGNANATIALNTTTNKVQANTSVLTNYLNANNQVWTNQLQANTRVVTDIAQANTLVITDQVQSNTSVNTTVLSVTTNAFANYSQANTKLVTGIAQANTLVVTDLVQSNTGVVTGVLQANNSVVSNTVQANNIVVTSLVLANNSIVTGVLQANTTIITDTTQANTSVVSNAVQANNIVVTNYVLANSQVTTGIVQANNQVITDTFTSNTLSTLNGTANVRGILNVTGAATTASVNLLANTQVGNTTNNRSLTVYGGLNITGTQTLNAPDTAAAFKSMSVTGDFSLNGSIVYNTNKLTLSSTTPNQTAYFGTFRTANGAANGVTANSFIRWNETSSIWDLTANNTAGNYYRIVTDEYKNDTITSTSTSTWATANSVNAVNDISATVGRYANSAFNYANSAYYTANSAQIYANGAFAQANAGFTFANGAFIQANAAFSRANTAANTFVGTTGSVTHSSGVVSFSSNNGVTVVATTANNLAVSTSQDLRTSASPTFASLTLTAPLAAPQGGTGQTSASAAFKSLLESNLGGTGTAGQVVTSLGNGSYQWSAAGSGGSGVTPGTTILSARNSYTANGAAGYTGNTFTIPVATSVNQVRAYIDGVRQFESEYSLNLAANTITFSTTPTNGNKVLLEVDGYYVNPYYANNIAYTVNNNISPTANTIQLAIDGLTSKLTAYYANTYTTTTFQLATMGITMPAGTSNTAFATTAYVQGLANNSGTLTTNITGNAGTVSNGVYTNGTYSNPSWITAIANTKITGTFPTTSITGLATSATTDTTNASNITSGTLPNARLSAVPNSALANTTVTINGQSVALGSSISVNSSIAITSSQVSGLAASATTNTTNASNISSGTLNAARLPYTMDQSVGTANNVQYASGYFGNTYTPTYTAGYITVEGDITGFYSSDILFKENVRDIPNALSKVTTIGGKLFDWKDEHLEKLGGEHDYFRPKADFGVIAQDVESVFPVATRTRNDGSLAVDYEKLCALAFQAIKELKEEVDALKGQIK